MVTTVTTSTIASLSDPANFGILTLVVVITFLALVVLREFGTSNDSQFYRAYRQILAAGIVPLMMIFGLTVLLRLIELVR